MSMKDLLEEIREETGHCGQCGESSCKEYYDSLPDVEL